MAKGPAGFIAKQYPLTDESFLLAWEALKSHYENPGILADNQQKTLLNLQLIYAENGNQLQKILNLPYET